MNYPVWYLPDTGGGILIALIAILHVFVSHFAVGGGLYLIFAEKKGIREKSQEILDFTKDHARFFILVTMVFGSITGVGIWFIIALVNPAATSYLIHTFVFGWAAEWVFFVVEITAAFIYFYMFGRMDSATHLKIGWVYFIAAWMSLFLINGIIGFMLTPGAWLNEQNFWIGFFNPSFFPSLVFRTFIALLMAGIYGSLSAAFVTNSEVREAMTRFSGKWSIIALIGTVPAGFWYLSVLPGPAKEMVLGKSPTITIMIQWGAASALIMMAVILVTTLYRPSLNKKWAAMIVMICGLGYFGSFEWVREAARRPYAINEVLYSNMIWKDEVEDLNDSGFLAAAKWVENKEVSENNILEAGEELFIHQCYACHTIDGINNPIKEATASMSFQALESYISKIHTVRYFMPPFAGTEPEIGALSSYIAAGVNGKKITREKTRDQGGALFDAHCASCHAREDLVLSLEGMSEDETLRMLASLDEISEEMVPFEGSSQEAEALANYLLGKNDDASERGKNGADGGDLYEINCSACHAAEDMSAIVDGMERDELRAALDQLETLSDEMMPFEGTAEEKDALADFLDTLRGDS